LTFLTSKMVKNGQNRDFLPIHGHFFFQTENTKRTVFEQNRLIACQTQKKTKKCVVSASYDTLRGW
jgi:hypothetical protein